MAALVAAVGSVTARLVAVESVAAKPEADKALAAVVVMSAGSD
jgi:hypothetical protein